jgi:hypothetical protein
VGRCGKEPSGSIEEGDFLTSQTISFSRRTLLHGVCLLFCPINSVLIVNAWYVCMLFMKIM